MTQSHSFLWLSNIPLYLNHILTTIIFSQDCGLSPCDVSALPRAISKSSFLRDHYTEQLISQSVQLLSRVRLFATPRTAARQASLPIANSRSPPKPMWVESVMPSNLLILCCPLLLLSSIFLSIRVFSNESVLSIRRPTIGASASA